MFYAISPLVLCMVYYGCRDAEWRPWSVFVGVHVVGLLCAAVFYGWSVIPILLGPWTLPFLSWAGFRKSYELFRHFHRNQLNVCLHGLFYPMRACGVFLLFSQLSELIWGTSEWWLRLDVWYLLGWVLLFIKISAPLWIRFASIGVVTALFLLADLLRQSGAWDADDPKWNSPVMPWALFIVGGMLQGLSHLLTKEEPAMLDYNSLEAKLAHQTLLPPFLILAVKEAISEARGKYPP